MIPCSTGPVTIYVDMYHCSEERPSMSDAELDAAVHAARLYLDDPAAGIGSREAVLRLFQYATEANLPGPECEAVFQMLIPPQGEYPRWREIGFFFAARYVVEVVARRSEIVPGQPLEGAVDIEISNIAASNLVRAYRQLLANGHRELQHPQLDALSAMSDPDRFGEVTSRVVQCGLARSLPPGVVLVPG